MSAPIYVRVWPTTPHRSSETRMRFRSTSDGRVRTIQNGLCACTEKKVKRCSTKELHVKKLLGPPSLTMLVVLMKERENRKLTRCNRSWPAASWRRRETVFELRDGPARYKFVEWFTVSTALRSSRRDARACSADVENGWGGSVGNFSGSVNRWKAESNVWGSSGADIVGVDGKVLWNDANVGQASVERVRARS